MIGVMEFHEILMAHQCHQAWHILSQDLSKIWISEFKPEPKLTLPTAMTPYLLLSYTVSYHTYMGPMIGVKVSHYMFSWHIGAKP
jgi:hypothetical protein